MDEQTSWKGHTFTLLIFAGIVVLSSIFFILGMLVGRAQGQKLATAEKPAKAEAKAAAPEDKPSFTFYDSVKKDDPPPLDSAAAKPAPAPTPPPAPRTPEPEAVSRPENVLNYQIGAVRKAADAEKLLSDVKKKGFRAFILAPSAGDANPFFRVQVGPFADPTEAQEVKKKLEAAGFSAILKK
jgi:cell division septation protein DedD